MRKATKKLALPRATVTRLDDCHLQHVLGGDTPPPPPPPPPTSQEKAYQKWDEYIRA